MAVGLSFQVQVFGNTKTEILESARVAWAEFLGMPSAELPWDVSMTVTSVEFVAQYTVPPEDRESYLTQHKDSLFVANVTITDTHSKT